MNELSKIVKQHRKKAGLTQKELADLAGVGKTVVFDIEKNKDTIQINTVLKILSALNIKISFDSPIELGDAQ
ncbi:MAG: type II toxin-antitoxin system Y4mF family antitoxin [Bacteroidetes bacterium]|nr:type II toxin-antitoxin system Y4mF family antitoxin [Bacteroidota bacterium]